MPLPMPPNIGNVQGPQGQNIYGYNPTLQGHRPNRAASVVEGIGAFMQGLTAEKEREKQKALSDGMQGIMLLKAGIPVSKTKIEKDLKKGGLELQVEGLKADPVAQQGQQAAMANPGVIDAAAGLFGGGGMGSHVTQMASQAKLPQVKTNPFQDALSSIEQQAASQVSSQQNELSLKNQKLNVLKAALSGDPKAQELLRVSGDFPKLTEFQEWMQAGRLVGGDERDMAKYWMDKEAAPLLSVISQNALGQARLSAEQYINAEERALKIADDHPLVPLDVIRKGVHAELRGDRAGSELLHKILRETPSKYREEQRWKQKNFDFDEKKWKAQYANEMKRLGFEGVNINLRAQELAVNKLKYMSELAANERDAYFKALTSGKVKGEELNAMKKAWVEAANKASGRRQFTVEDINEGSWIFDPELEIRSAAPSAKAEAAVDAAMGTPTITPVPSSLPAGYTPRPSNEGSFDPAGIGIPPLTRPNMPSPMDSQMLQEMLRRSGVRDWMQSGANTFGGRGPI